MHFACDEPDHNWSVSCMSHQCALLPSVTDTFQVVMTSDDEDSSTTGLVGHKVGLTRILYVPEVEARNKRKMDRWKR